MRGGGALLVILLAILVGGLALLFTSGDGQVLGLEDDRFAQLVQLTAISVFLGSGILIARRMALGPTLRNAAIWLLILAGLLAVYAYGSELRGVGQRIQAALLPGSVVPLGTDGGQVMATRGGDEHFRIDAEINGAPVQMLVDTGASIVAIDRGTAQDAGIDIDALVYSAQIRTANGIASAAPVRLDSVRVGGIERRNVAAVVTEGDGIGIDLLGMSFLGTLSSVDFRGDRLVLTD